MLYPIKNAREIVLGNLEPEALGAYSTDQKTFVVELQEPTPYFLSLLTHSTTYPVHPKSIEQHGASVTRPGNLVTNGAFVLSEWKVQDYIKLDRNPTYWDAKKTTLESANKIPKPY